MLHVCANFACLMSCFPILQIPVCMELVKSIAVFKKKSDCLMFIENFYNTGILYTKNLTFFFSSFFVGRVFCSRQLLESELSPVLRLFYW